MNPVHQNRRALSATEIVTQLSQLNGEQPVGWRLIDGSLEKTFSFKNFHETMGFVNAVAFIANAVTGRAPFAEDLLAFAGVPSEFERLRELIHNILPLRL